MLGAQCRRGSLQTDCPSGEIHKEHSEFPGRRSQVCSDCKRSHRNQQVRDRRKQKRQQEDSEAEVRARSNQRYNDDRGRGLDMVNAEPAERSNPRAERSSSPAPRKQRGARNANTRYKTLKPKPPYQPGSDSYSQNSGNTSTSAQSQPASTVTSQPDYDTWSQNSENVPTHTSSPSLRQPTPTRPWEHAFASRLEKDSEPPPTSVQAAPNRRSSPSTPKSYQQERVRWW